MRVVKPYWRLRIRTIPVIKNPVVIDHEPTEADIRKVIEIFTNKQFIDLKHGEVEVEKIYKFSTVPCPNCGETKELCACFRNVYNK